VNANQIIVLEQGRILEKAVGRDGRSAHELLLAREGAYAQLYNRQFRKQKAVESDGRNGTHPEILSPALATL